jgi:transcriptional regulator with XRE-family HTH domain/Zn-dependent peptidase ImmA (M78 family)
MALSKSLIRQSHFLGTKVRNLRKRNHLTMEDLSARCIRINPEYAPSVSYLSMIERGKRVPSIEMLEVIAEVFQKSPDWFLDDQPEQIDITPDKGNRGGLSGIALEPSFLFSEGILQIAIPELLSQAGITGRQFAQLLIRTHQESLQNHFPDLERAAETVGQKKLNLTIEDLIDIARHLGLRIHWFSASPQEITDELGLTAKQLVTSYFEPPCSIHLNERMKQYPTRMKYDLAVYIGHSILHSKDGCKTVLSIGHTSSWEEPTNTLPNYELNSKDILQAWRDFESSFFAGALLCPKVPFRQLLDRNGYEISAHKKAGISPSVAMRRMTVVSPYPHWHYFDAYGEGKLKAVYRGNGIPLPWGNMRKVDDPCQHWAVFQQLVRPEPTSCAQLSILHVGDEPRIYCCESINVIDPAGNPRVLCAGIDLNPAIDAQGGDAKQTAVDLRDSCVKGGGTTAIPPTIKKDLKTIAKILNINWIERGIENRAQLICSRGRVCPRQPSCYQTHEQPEPQNTDNTIATGTITTKIID